jgi:Ran GTPase-activating protein (RanGAP) involved in mRNA processing and transport
VTKTRKAPKPVPSSALEKAIDTVDASSLRHTIKSICKRNPALLKDLEDQWLVRGKDIIRYHENTDSEEDSDSDNVSSEDEDDFDSENEDELEYEREERRRVKKLIEVGDDEAVGRHAKCENCGEEFDVTSNDRGDCVWHSGMYCPNLLLVEKLKIIRRERA